MQKDKSRNIIFVHLWNNFSGSPNVLRTVVDGLTDLGYKTTVISSYNNNGFLSGVKGEKININYRFERNIVLRLIQFIRFQIMGSNYIRKSTTNDIIYLNTIQPFLPALIAKLKKRKIIYHIHEAYPKPGLFQRFLFFIVKKTASQIICVSNFVKDNLDDISKAKAIVVYNSLSPDFLSGVVKKSNNGKVNKVLMISSARKYKGIFEFCDLALKMPDFEFTLACDLSQSDLDRLFADYKGIPNLHLLPTQGNLHQHYSTHDLIVNLSNPRMIIETFGLTVLEGMVYGLPAIVPPVGGIAELVDDGVNGYKIDVNYQNELIDGIKKIMGNQGVYDKMMENARLKSINFSHNIQLKNIEQVIRTA